MFYEKHGKEIKAFGPNSAKSIINASIYSVDGGVMIAGTAKAVGTFDPRFMYGPYGSIDEAKRILETL